MKTVNVNAQKQKSISDSDTDKWHPSTFYFVCPDMKFVFNLPHEKDKSGVANILFRKGTGDIHQLDTVKNNERYYNPLSGEYDVILLYNNGKYVVLPNVMFEKGINEEIDMEHLDVRASDVDSRNWLALRCFTQSIGDKEREFFFKFVSEKRTRGYILMEDCGASDFAQARIALQDNRKAGGCTFDGYFEIDFDEPVVTLEFYYFTLEFEYHDVKKNSGVFYVFKGYDPEVTKDIKTGPIMKRAP